MAISLIPIAFSCRSQNVLRPGCGELMNKFKLKPGLKFTPQEQRYIVLDTATQSTYRVGETEYAILQQFAELIDPEDVGLKLRAEAGLNVPYDVLFRFIEQAATLGLLTL